MGFFSLYGIQEFLSKRHLRGLVRRGLKLGKNVYIHTRAIIDNDLCWLVSIGDDCIISANVVILAHDAATERHLGYVKIDKVTIGCRTYIGAGAIILPGVNIGNDVIVGAGSVVTHDIPDNSVAVGNPAGVIESTSKFVEKHRRNLTTRASRLRGKALQSSESKRVIQEALSDGAFYV